jgi:hypothetical protein
MTVQIGTYPENIDKEFCVDSGHLADQAASRAPDVDLSD